MGWGKVPLPTPSSTDSFPLVFSYLLLSQQMIPREGPW